jgi:hypothetical protein
MIAFYSNYDYQPERPNSKPEASPTSQLSSALAPKAYMSFLRERLQRASEDKIASIAHAAYERQNSAVVEKLITMCCSLWRDSDNTANSFGARSFRAAALLVNDQATPLSTPEPAKIAFLNKWIGAMQNSFLLESAPLPSVTAIHQATSSLLELAIKLGESVPRSLFNESYCMILERLRINLLLAQETEYSAPELHNKLSDYVLDQIEIRRSLSLRKLTLLPMFFGLALELKDAEIATYVAQSNERLLKLFSWAEQQKASYSDLGKLKDQQQTDIFRDTLHEVIGSGLDALKTMQAQSQEKFATIWQRALETLPSESIPWRTSLHGLIESAPKLSTRWVDMVISDILNHANTDNLMLLLNIASTVSGIGVLYDVISDRSSAEKDRICYCLREMKGQLLQNQMPHLVSHDITAAERAKLLKVLLESLEE